MDFRKARVFARSLNLHDQEEWENYINRWQLTNGSKSKIIPLKPDIIYRHLGWNGWDDWLGQSQDQVQEETNLKSGDGSLFSEWTLWNAQEKTSWLPFREARTIVREFRFEYEEEWVLYVQGKFPGRRPLPDDIPQNPDQIYRMHGWKGWKDWLVSPENRIEYAGFHKAREFARSLRIMEPTGWRAFMNQSTALLNEYKMIMPERPHLEYKDKGWVSWEDWLGTAIKFHDFQTTRKFIHSLKLSNRNDWVRYCSGQWTLKYRKSENIYTYPEIAFRNEGWAGWEDWLGTGSRMTDKPGYDLPDGAFECRCKGMIENCPDCDGKGYFYK
jgi:hypothetical protein